MTTQIKLGQEVKDRITGFHGIAVVTMEFLNGCRRIEVQPKVNKDGIMPEEKTFDEPDLEVIGRGILSEEKLPEKPERNYGDRNFIPTRIGH